MIKVLITVGMYDSNPKELPIVEMNLPEIPKIGDMIMLTPELKELIEKKKKEWDLVSGVKINYVVAVAYMNEAESPLIMLGGNPNRFSVDIVYENKIVGAYLRSIPEIGDSIYVKEFDSEHYLYVQDIYYYAHNGIISIRVDKEYKRCREVHVYNKVDVTVDNTYSIPVEVRNYEAVPVEIKSSRVRSIPVEITNDIVPVDVRR